MGVANSKPFFSYLRTHQASDSLKVPLSPYFFLIKIMQKIQLSIETKNKLLKHKIKVGYIKLNLESCMAPKVSQLISMVSFPNVTVRRLSAYVGLSKEYFSI